MKLIQFVVFQLFMMPNLLSAQQMMVKSFDFEQQAMDSFYVDSIVSQEAKQTPHNTAGLEIQYLDEVKPVVNVWPNSQYTKKQLASDDLDLDKFPASTAIKLFYQRDNWLHSLCSASMISNEHLLTSMHCLAQPQTEIIKYDTIWACPTYDGGAFDEDLDCVMITHAYFLSNWSVSNEDMTVLRLAEPLGLQTGYLGVGYEPNDAKLFHKQYAKFSYPGVPELGGNIDYNGDSLYFSWGEINMVGKHSLGVLDAIASQGESGSSLFAYRNNQSYTIFGVLNYSHDMRHVRIDKALFTMIQHVITEELWASASEAKEASVSIYPNPTTGIVYLDSDQQELTHVQLYDGSGNMVNAPWNSDYLDLSELSSGMYLLRYSLGEGSDAVRGVSQIFRR